MFIEDYVKHFFDNIAKKPTVFETLPSKSFYLDPTKKIMGAAVLAILGGVTLGSYKWACNDRKPSRPLAQLTDSDFALPARGRLENSENR